MMSGARELAQGSPGNLFFLKVPNPAQKGEHVVLMTREPPRFAERFLASPFHHCKHFF
jgi:hypothetical protein